MLLVSAVQQHGSALSILCPLPFQPPSHLPPRPLLQVITELWGGLPESYGSLLLAVSFTDGDVHVSKLLSQFAPPSPSLSVLSLISMSAPLFLPFKQVHQHRFSRSHIYVLIYGICFSPSNLLQALGSSMSLELTQIHSFLWLSNIPLCM